MTGTKTKTSLLFITTLGVYLGLLIVGGAAPQVFAHSATTRHFEISDEIEIEDDLDRDPDADRAEVRLSLLTYFQDVEFFLKALDRLGQTKQFNAASDSFEVAQSSQLPCVASNKTGSYTARKFVTGNEALRPWLESFSKLLTDGYSLGDCLPNNRFAPDEATDSAFNFHLDKKAFQIEVAVRKASPQAAKLLAEEIGSTFRLLRDQKNEAVRLKIYENTTFRIQNDQIFIVTRLPRAGLIPIF